MHKKIDRHSVEPQLNVVGKYVKQTYRMEYAKTSWCLMCIMIMKLNWMFIIIVILYCTFTIQRVIQVTQVSSVWVQCIFHSPHSPGHIWTLRRPFTCSSIAFSPSLSIVRTMAPFWSFVRRLDTPECFSVHCVDAVVLAVRVVGLCVFACTSLPSYSLSFSSSLTLNFDIVPFLTRMMSITFDRWSGRPYNVWTMLDRWSTLFVPLPLNVILILKWKHYIANKWGHYYYFWSIVIDQFRMLG